MTQTAETKGSSAGEGEKYETKNKLRKRELTTSLPSRLGELENIAVTHGAEEDHCQRHQSQLHSPCCLRGHAGSPPATRWIRLGGGGPFLRGTGESLFCWDGWSLLSPVALLSPSVWLSLSPPLSLRLFHSSGCCVVEGDAAVASPNKPEAQQAITLVVVLANGSRQGRVVGWLERGLRSCLEDKEEERMERRLTNFWWFNPWSSGWAGREAGNLPSKESLLWVSECLPWQVCVFWRRSKTRQTEQSWILAYVWQHIYLKNRRQEDGEQASGKG